MLPVKCVYRRVHNKSRRLRPLTFAQFKSFAMYVSYYFNYLEAHEISAVLDFISVLGLCLWSGSGMSGMCFIGLTLDGLGVDGLRFYDQYFTHGFNMNFWVFPV